MTAETSQTLDRGLRVLKLLADTDHGLTVTELAAKLGVNRTVVYRLLATLEQHALVRRDLGGRARVGLGVLRLAHQVHPLLREAALPALRSLAEDIGATAHLTLVDGTRGAGRRRGRADLDRLPRGLPHRLPAPAGPGRGGPGDPGRPRHAADTGREPLGALRGRPPSGHAPEDGREGGQEPRTTTGGRQWCGRHRARSPRALATDQVRVRAHHGELEAGASGAAAPLLGVPGVEGSVGVVMLCGRVPERVGPRVVRRHGGRTRCADGPRPRCRSTGSRAASGGPARSGWAGPGRVK